MGRRLIVSDKAVIEEQDELTKEQTDDGVSNEAIEKQEEKTNKKIDNGIYNATAKQDEELTKIKLADKDSDVVVKQEDLTIAQAVNGDTNEVNRFDEEEYVILTGSEIISYREAVETEPLEIWVGDFPAIVMSIIDDTINGEDK